MVNIYELLKIPHTATEAEIKAAIANAFVEGSAPEPALTKAREWLLNPETRAKYDARLLAENPHLRQPEAPPTPQAVSLMQPKRAATKEEREAILAAKQAKDAPKPEPELVPLEDDDEVFYHQPWYREPKYLIPAIIVGVSLAGFVGYKLAKTDPTSPTVAGAVTKVVKSDPAAPILEYVKNQTRDPDTVKFKEVSFRENDFEGKHFKTVCGQINAKNAMGGYVGYNYFYAYDVDGKIEAYIGPNNGGDMSPEGFALNFKRTCLEK